MFASTVRPPAASPAGAQPEPSVANKLWVRSERSIVASGSVAAPGALATICQVMGFQTWEAQDIYRLDYWAAYSGAAAPALDIEIAIANVSYFRLPMVIDKNVSCSGTLYLAPNSQTITLRSVAGDADATYVGSLILTRQQQGFRAE